MTAPTRQAILQTYRTILRYSNPKINGRRARTSCLTGPLSEHIQQQFRDNRNADNETSKELFRQASDLATMLTCSFTHAEAVFDAGWCLQTVC